MAPAFMRNKCSLKIVNSHIAARSTLNAIAESGHVLGRKDLPGRIVATGRSDFKLVGISHSSTHKIFCACHDKGIFSDIEDNPFICSGKNVLLATFRTLCAALYQKEREFRSLRRQRELANEFGLLPDKGFLSYVDELARSLEHHLTALTQFHDFLSCRLYMEDYAKVGYYIVEFDCIFPIVFCTAHTITLDEDGAFSGRPSEDSKRGYIFVSTVNSGGRTFLIFSWCADYFRTRESLGFPINLFIMPDLSKDILNEIVSKLIGLSNKFFINPIWFRSLNEVTKQYITLIAEPTDLQLMFGHLPPKPIELNYLLPVAVDIHRFCPAG